MNELDELAGLIAAIFFTPFLAVSALLGAAYLALTIIDLVVGVFSPDEVSRYE